MRVWSVSRLAIISGSVAFLAPEIGIVPLSRRPPTMRMRSMWPWLLALARVFAPKLVAPAAARSAPKRRPKTQSRRGITAKVRTTLSGRLRFVLGFRPRRANRRGVALAPRAAGGVLAPAGLGLAAPEVFPQGRL